MKDEPSPYASYSLKALALLLNSAPGDSAEHRAIRAEVRRREINSAPDTETHLLFTAEEWSRTLQRVTFTTTERASPLTASACQGAA